MNKAQKEVIKYTLQQEKRTINELKKVYRKAIDDCETKIKDLSSRTDMENLQSIIYQKKYQEALKKQLNGILDDLESKQYKTVDKYIKDCYENGYTGVMYDLQSQGIPITIPIDQKQVVKAIRTDSKISKRYYTKENPAKGRLKEDVDRLKTSIRAEVSRGVANGSTWSEVAHKVARGMNSAFPTAYNSALRIARTEGHRVQQSATFDAQVKAKECGADVVKQWDATLDGVTRPHHRELDGQIREIEEAFETFDGATAMYPGDFGTPAEDCNCRCCSLQRAKWGLDQAELDALRERAEYFGLDKNDSFEDFKSKYLNNVTKESGTFKDN